MPATIKDIAKRLNMSISTVSYALKGGPRSVSDDTKARVLAAAKDLDYRPNRIASSMVTGRSHTIGVLFDHSHPDMVAGPFNQLLLNSIFRVAHELKQDMLIYRGFGARDLDANLSHVLDGRGDGILLIYPPADAPILRELAKRRMPHVSLGSPPCDGSPAFGVDNEAGSYRMLEHLYSLGHRRIAHIRGSMEYTDAVQRLIAYRQFVRSRRLPVGDELIIDGHFHMEDGQEGLIKLMSLPTPPTAIFCGNDDMALGAIFAAQKLGLRVPQDISIAGFDDAELNPRYGMQLTTIRQPIPEMIRAALQNLLGLIDGQIIDKSQTFAPQLMVRESTGKLNLGTGALCYEEEPASLYAH